MTSDQLTIHYTPHPTTPVTGFGGNLTGQFDATCYNGGNPCTQLSSATHWLPYTLSSLATNHSRLTTYDLEICGFSTEVWALPFLALPCVCPLPLRG
ncbi:hypothetical protein [Chroococcidiopsis sp.]|uniref:hypothetical protein n=1 Tax=Chroococcidiopsis sp. TaxID=3088168 RepID=UPI003F3C71F9